MSTYADKSQENKSHPMAIGSVVNTGSRKLSGSDPTFKVWDNRPEAIAQRKLQAMANESPQLKQLRAFREMASIQPAAQFQRVTNNSRQQPMQRKPIGIMFKGQVLDTDRPEEIWKYFNTIEDEKIALALMTALETAGELELAGKIEDAWADYLESITDYDDEYGDYEEQYNSTENTGGGGGDPGEYKRSGTKSQRDKWYGGFANNKPAQDWWHHNKNQLSGGKDLTKDTARDMFDLYKKSLKK